MFIFDTHVVSELMCPAPNPVIVSWFAERATSNLFLTAVTEAELRYGLAIMPRASAGTDLRPALNGC